MTNQVLQISCHSVTDKRAGADAPVLALAGAPNSGKSTMFNALTKSSVTMGNWPGTTVEVSRGVWRYRPGVDPCPDVDADCADQCKNVQDCIPMTVIDLPGAYSLEPLSPDEELTRDLMTHPTDRPDCVIVTADAAHLARSLYLVAELRERGLPMVVAITMEDIAKSQGIRVDTYALSQSLGCPVVATDPRRRRGLDNLGRAVAKVLGDPWPAPRLVATTESDDLAAADERFTWIASAIDKGTVTTGEAQATMTAKVDRFILAPVLGPVFFLGVMWLVFQATTTVAGPMQDWLDQLFSGPVSQWATAALATLGLDETWVAGFVVSGLIAGVGSLLTFVPLMAIMFVLLALLEDSGYMARAAVIADRLMRAIGLPGKAFLPIIVGFGCNVPAVSATRILGDARQRILTALLVPFASCSARYTVYVLVGVTFFDEYAGTVVFAMYLVSILLMVVIGLVLRHTVWRTMGAEPLVMDLPSYQIPTLRLTAAVTWQRLSGFLKTASGIIVACVTIVWLLQSIPARGDAGFGEVPVEDSVYAVAAQAVTPVFAPAGFGQWQSVSALGVGFVAKEAVISSWAQTYALDEPEAEDEPGDLGTRILADFDKSSGGHPIPAALAFLVFLLAYPPCFATIAAQWREIRGKWTLIGVAMQTLVAYILAVLVFQVGSLFW